MVRYELIPITHDELIHFCRLGGRIYLHNEFYQAGVNPRFDNAVRKHSTYDMRSDIYLIGATPRMFHRLGAENEAELYTRALIFEEGRTQRSPKTNARILVIHEI